MNVAIDAMNIAKDAMDIIPAKAAFVAVSVILTMIRVRFLRSVLADCWITFSGLNGERIGLR